jgi:23S rRNA pseudouridine1911/1915/1917 synthase
MSLEILYEDNHLIFVDKPAGQLTQADRSGSRSLLEAIKDHIKQRDNKPGNVFLGMVQRLDKPVSGVLVFAKTSKAASRLSESIRKRQVFKFYLALTEISEGGSTHPQGWREQRHYLYRRKDITLVADAAEEGAQPAVLLLRTLEVNNGYGLHLVRLLTGRKHQIRAQLSALGLPICGDAKYGSKTPYDQAGIGLHSICLGLIHPVRREPLTIFSGVPEAMHAYLNAPMKLDLSTIIQNEIDWDQTS